MPRPKKYRNVCALPQTLSFAPEGTSDYAEAVILTVEEYEAIRLIDKEGLSQEQCRLPGQRCSRFTRRPGKSWRMYWWTDFRCESKAAITGSAAAAEVTVPTVSATKRKPVKSMKNRKEKQL